MKRIIYILLLSFILSKKIIIAPYIDQTKKWPKGYESVTTVMALQYLAKNISR